MKYEGMYKGIPVYSDPECPPDFLYFINRDRLKVRKPKRKNGRPNKTYRVNKFSVFLLTRDETNNPR